MTIRIVQEFIENYRFAHITEIKFAVELFGENVTWNNVIFHRSNWETSRFEKSYDKFEENELTIGKFRKWIEAEHETNFCPHVTLKNFKNIEPNRILILHSEDHDKSPQNVKYWRNRVVKFAKEKTDTLMYKYNFCMGQRRHFQSLVFNELGGNAGWASENPKVILWDKNWRSFVMEEALDSEFLNLSQFLKNFEAGNLRPFIKSETPPPEAEKAGDHVKVAVGTTFNKIVLDTQKDTLVAIVAQDCGYCQALFPTLKKLARSLEEEESVEIVTIDGKFNHPPRAYEYKGFPTIYFAKKFQKNEPIPYKGQRTEEALLEFIKEHSSKKAIKIDGVPEKEYDYDEIVAASEIEVDEIIEGDSQKSAEHDEL
ncbi:unnamed protein product [Oikopleura dioica]|uniref:Protein disulfide-isomerase A3 n=1 Tax=Oikopleura dioica TaxID=34765 RepID=E4XCU1_OIKDI|nr:unnamed protein product [Oikopleura dioica]